MSKSKNVIDFYVICNKLKTLIRKGWQDWNVQSNRIESVAEHIYGTQMLALAMYSEYEYEIDILKVIYMLAIHELEETKINDLTMFDIDSKTKTEIGHKAVNEILEPLLSKQEILSIILEFDDRKTKEAKFAYYCDKLECDIQAKLYDEMGYVDLNHQENNKSFNDPVVKEFLDNDMSWSEMWLSFGQKKYNYDENFKEVSDYVLSNKIF